MEVELISIWLRDIKLTVVQQHCKTGLGTKS